MLGLIIKCITALCLGVIVYEIVVRICEVVFACCCVKNDYEDNEIDIQCDKDLQDLLKQLDNDFEKLFKEEIEDEEK